ncbi:MAG: hypothetical protein DRP30_04825 [Thermotoga sp.]|nr:MAG: hypothetical protein DRP30_04825 [Thermotoga sp.]
MENESSSRNLGSEQSSISCPYTEALLLPISRKVLVRFTRVHSGTLSMAWRAVLGRRFSGWSITITPRSGSKWNDAISPGERYMEDEY